MNAKHTKERILALEELNTLLSASLTKAEKQRDALLAALNKIVAVASGEDQVADDDTGGLEWIDKFARTAIAAIESGKVPT